MQRRAFLLAAAAVQLGAHHLGHGFVDDGRQWTVRSGIHVRLAVYGGELRTNSAYQQRFVIKLALVAALLSLAAWNKLSLTPLLAQSYALGAARLRRSIRCEMAVALVILAATAWIVSTSPSE